MPAKVYLHASQLVTNDAVAAKGGVGVTADDLGIIEDGALALDADGKVRWYGPTAELPKRFLKGARKVDATGKTLAPALADCHTHLVFAGIRDDEFEMRLGGMSYQQIAARGGGIVKSVAATRAASEAELLRLAKPRVEQCMALGVRILEIKSGYGLDWPTERKVLRVIARLKKLYAGRMIIRSTFLGAHAFPPGTRSEGEREAYVAAVMGEMLPAVVREKLADACDVFFDEGYFTEEQSRRILLKARSLGLQIKLHADELANTGGARLAASLGALSADHLLKADDRGLAAMAQAGVVAVILPGTAFYLGLPYASMAKLRATKVCVALATDFNPGSSPCNHLPFIMSLACLQMGMTMPEAFSAATFGGARALGLHEDQGHITIGRRPLVALFDCPGYAGLIGQVAHPGLCTGL